MAQAKQTQLAPRLQPRSIRDVTRFLYQSGVEGVRLERGRGFFYFAGAPILNWLNRAVVTPDLASRTLGAWLEEYRRMARQNASRDPFSRCEHDQRQAFKPRGIHRGLVDPI